MSGFLQYGDNPKTQQRVWSVITRTKPPVLYLYAAAQVGISVIDNSVSVTSTYSLLSVFHCYLRMHVMLSYTDVTTATT